MKICENLEVNFMQVLITSTLKLFAVLYINISREQGIDTN